MQTVKIKWIANPAGFLHAYSIGDVCDMEIKKADLLAAEGAIEILETKTASKADPAEPGKKSRKK